MPEKTGVDRLLTVTEIKSILEPCCCELPHDANGERKLATHHASTVDNYCEYCTCEKCQRTLIRKALIAMARESNQRGVTDG